MASNVQDGEDKSDENSKRPQFGTRFLTQDKNVFDHNAWDNVQWDEEQERKAKLITLEQATKAMTLQEQEKYEKEADKYWDDFYSIHQNRFFKDRKWLFTEFSELSYDYLEKYNKSFDSANGVHNKGNNFPGIEAKYRFFEVGCGVGNTVFPIIQTNNNKDLMVYCCDLSTTGVNHVKSHPDYDVRTCHAFVCDVSNPQASFPFPENSLDAILLIFVLSAIHPDKVQNVINSLARHLKPGGCILFRDYGRYDMAQLRFKDNRCLGENFYVRGDGTRVYFFEQKELKQLFENAGLEELQNTVDRRLQVNRGRQLKMYRVFVQCKYRKPLK